MAVDKDKPWTWVKYREGLCNSCIAACCMMPVEVTGEDLVLLGLADENEVRIAPKRVYKDLKKRGVVVSYRESTGFFMLTQKANGDCYFLHPVTRLCTVYDSRPGVCRKFPSTGPKPGYCPSSKRTSVSK